MFWDNFIRLCNDKGISPNRVCAELGFSTAIATKWKKGALPRSTTLKSLADYFGVSADHLLEKDDKGNTEHSSSFLNITTASDKSPNKFFTSHEMSIIAAYRAQPELQPAVDKLLGVDRDEQVYLYTAAHSKTQKPDTVIGISKDVWEKIKNAPETDEDLI